MRVLITLPLIALLSMPLFGQGTASGELPTLLLTLMAIVAILILVLVVLVGNAMLHVRAKELGVSGASNYSVFPALSELFGNGLPSYIKDQPVIRLKKGHDIRLKGAAVPEIRETRAKAFAVQPPDFRGLSPIPKLMVEVGATVKAGEPIMFDKARPEVVFASPVSGELVELRRGAKRAVSHLVVLADKEQQYHAVNVPGEGASREELVSFLCGSGFWPFIMQRPYNVMADPAKTPRHIFISTFDTAPLAPDNNLIVGTDGDAFQRGLDVLARLTDGKVHLGLNAGSLEAPSPFFTEARGVEKHWFQGAHPAGCVGVQIHQINPIRPGDVLWTLGVQEVMMLGRLFRDGRLDTTRIIALTGAELSRTGYVRTHVGARIQDLLDEQPASDMPLRYISGDVLTGTASQPDDFLRAHDDQLTLVQEGKTHEMFGWLLPIRPRPSVSRTFPNFLMPNMEFTAETNTHGEERAFVVTGLYEDVLPMDIYPQHLLKAVLAGDFERMEGLGIYEVVEEDLALCEFVCPSKVNVQQILRDGLNMMQEQG